MARISGWEREKHNITHLLYLQALEHRTSSEKAANRRVAVGLRTIITIYSEIMLIRPPKINTSYLLKTLFANSLLPDK